MVQLHANHVPSSVCQVPCVHETEHVPKLLWGLVQLPLCTCLSPPQHGGLVLSVLSLWEVWDHIHRARRKGMVWWNSACCTDMQTTRRGGRYPSPVFTSMSVRVQLNRSTNPSVWGYVVVLTFFIPITAHNSCTKLERKAGPRSETNWEGTPCWLITCSTSRRAMVKSV